MARPGAAQHKVTVPTAPPPAAKTTTFRDKRYGVRLEVPPGWELNRKDRQVSTFRLDARSAAPGSQMRGVASLSFNPYPRSVLSGAFVYFSVAPHSNDKSCAAAVSGIESGVTAANLENETSRRPNESESIGGMQFAHGHDEHGGVCVEARDEVYTAFRKGSCYRFDLTVNTFCSISSGAADLTQEQMRSLEAQMTGILSTVSLDWEKNGPQPVPMPALPATPVLPKPQRERSHISTGLGS